MRDVFERAPVTCRIQIVITGSFAAALLFSLLADPVVAKIGLCEFALAVSLALFGMFGVIELVRSGLRVPEHGRTALAALLVFLVSFVVGLMLGWFRGNPLWPMARSFLPYAIMFTALPLIFSRLSAFHVPTALATVVTVGVLQAVYQIYVFLLLNAGTKSPVLILVNRITLYDARVTIPFVVAANAIVLAFVGRGFGRTIFLICLSTLFLVASLVTLTRTLVIACLVATAVTALALLLPPVVERSRRLMQYLRPMGALAPAVLAVAVIFANPIMRQIPHGFDIRIAIEQSLPSDPLADFDVLTELLASEVGAQRAKAILSGVDTVRGGFIAIRREGDVPLTIRVLESYVKKRGMEEETTQLAAVLLAAFSSNVPGATELGGGRISQEWVPAVATYINGGPLTWLFGIGVGTSFETADGSPRTYVHNYPLYLLLYNGIVGALAYLVLQANLALWFLRRWLKNGDQAALACLALLTSLGVFSLFFAVHKLIAYNLIMTLAFVAAFKRTAATRSVAETAAA
jgi:hypothetical protein